MGNANICRGRVNHDPKVVLGVIDDLYKKFQPLFNVFCLPKKINKNRYYDENGEKLLFLAFGR